MRKLAARALVLSLVAAGLLLVPSSAEAVTTPWVITRVNGTTVGVNRNNGTATASASCGASSRVLFGFVKQSGSDDVRRLSETYTAGGYSVLVQNQTLAAGSVTLTATVLCVPSNYFSAPAVVVRGEFSTADDHIGEGTVFCPAGYLGLNASVTSTSASKTLLTSAPIADRTGWEVRGWDNSLSTKVTADVNCVLATDVPGAKSYTHLDAGGWGAGASVDCASGLAPITGGTVMFGGDGGAITINQQMTTTGVASTTLDLSGGSMISTVICVPASKPSVSPISGPQGWLNTNSVSWSFTASDPASAGGYTLSTLCTVSHPGTSGSPAPCSSPVNLSSLAEGVHFIEVKAVTSDGRVSDSQFRGVTVDTIDPTVAFADASGSFKGTSPTIQFQVADANQVPSLFCSVDAGSSSPCGTLQSGSYVGAQSVQLSDLSEGNHTLHVTPQDGATNSATYDLVFNVDSVAPAASLSKPSSPFQTALSTKAVWSGSDSNSGVASYQLRSRSAAYNGTFSSYSAPTDLAAGTTSKSFSGLVPGTTYCYSVRALDAAQNASGWTADKCTAVPLDDKSMTKSKGWTSAKTKGWFKKTSVSTTKKGATLTKSATVKRIEVIAQKCSSCGVIGVFVGKALVGKINLKAAKSSRATIVLPVFSLRKGTVKLKVLSSGKLVKIDAVGMSAA